MNIEKGFVPNIEKEDPPNIIIKRAVEAPSKVKENPFYDAEIWGRANSLDDIYLPDSDEALSFSIAAHEIGHLVDKGKILNTGLDNFKATREEEERAWNVGWKYLKKYFLEYYDNPKDISNIEESFVEIKDLFMKVTNMSEELYLKKGSLDGFKREEIDNILKQRRQNFFSHKGEEVKNIFNEIKKKKNGIKPDWDKFIGVVKKAVKDVVRDNKI